MSVTFGGRTSSHHVDLSSLRLTGQSVAPIHGGKHEHSNPRRPVDAVARTLDTKAHPETRVFVHKERQGFGGGFKILEEYRKNKMKRKGDLRKAEDDDEQENKDQNQVTKEEIFQLLNLGNAEGSIGAGKYGNSSKKALTNDLIEGLEKDLERLKRFEENLRIRKLRTMKGGDKIINETDEDRYNASIGAMHADLTSQGAHLIEANHERKQLMRHKAGQLDSLKNLDINELEEERLATQKKIDELTEIYLQQKEMQSAGTAQMMRRKMGYDKRRASPQRSQSGQRREREEQQLSDRPDLSEDEEAQPVSSKARGRKRSQKRSRSIRFEGEADEDNNEFGREEEDTPPTRSRSRKAKSRVAFDEPKNLDGKPVKSALKLSKLDAEDDGKSNWERIREGGARAESRDRSRGSSKSRSMPASRSVGLRSSSGNRVFKEPKHGIGGQGTNSRREAFEAKFDKYRANRKTKETIEKRSQLLEQPDFDITTKNRRSPSKKARKYTTVVGAEIDFKPSGKFEADQLMPEGYENALMREELMDTRRDPFRVLGVSQEDKMTFFLLKWVFDYIKQDSDHDDEQLQGKAYVNKRDLVSQLSKNPELMNALDIKSKRELNDQVELAHCAKKNCLTWDEFLDFFFLKNATLEDRIDGNDWWNKLDQNGQPIIEEAPIDKTVSATFDDDLLDENNPEKQKYGSKMSRGARLLKEFKEVPMTPALEFLMHTRKQKVEFDVEEDFKNMQETKATSGGMDAMRSTGMRGKASLFSSGGPIVDQEAVDAQLGISREKSKCLLLPSQIETMRQEYENMDKYNDGILMRADFIKHLRMDMKVVDFIDAEAVRVAGQKAKILTLDQVFYEIERDEMYEMMQMSKQDDEINHKEFITWREFLSYFEDYKEIEERNKKSKQFQATRDTLQGKQQDQSAEHIDQEEEFKTLLEAEKERRLQDLPKLRPQDMIDISEDQVRLIKSIYDSQQKVGTAVSTTTFFLALRKHKDVRNILTAIARDPEGHSRLPKETFQQVFDRMEKDVQQVKTVEWPTIIEYFTKLGRPLSKDEIQRLQDEDKRMKEEAEEIKRREEEAERRRMARLMEDIEGDQEDGGADGKKERKRPNFRLDSDEDGDFSERDDDKVFQGFDNSDEFDSDEEDDLERELDGKPRMMARHQSAKALGRGSENLNSKRITSDEYMHQLRAKSNRKGRYGVTVPEPFNFEIRDQQAKKSNTRERKVNEMVMEKKIEEENMLKHQFRHKPIPAAVLIPRYQQIMDQNEERRMRVKQESIQITKQREKPFSFWEREKIKMAKKNDPEAGLVQDCKRPPFKANRMPDFSSIRIYSEEMALKEEERLKRIHHEAEKSYARAAMPRRMHQAMENRKNQPKKAQQEEFSFRPMVNEPKTGAQFKKLQDKFQEKLNKTKSEKSVTVPKPFKAESNNRSKPLQRDYVNEGPPGARTANAIEQATGGDKLMATLAAKTNKTRSSVGKPPAKQPATTRAAVLLQQRRREEFEKKKAEEERKAKEDADRVARQNQLKGTVQGMLKGSIQSAQKEIDEKVKNDRRAAREQERQTKEKLAEGIQKARQRPMLVESYNKGTYRANNLAKAQTLKKYVQVFKDAGMTDKEIEKHAQLSLADKEALEEDKFYEAQKKMYGKK